MREVRWRLHDRGSIYIPERDLQSDPGKISDRGDVFQVPLLHGALMKDRYPTEGAAILGTVLYTELIGRMAQD